MIGRTVGQLTVGDAAELSRMVIAGDIAGYVDSVGDKNPIHSDLTFAATTPFREPIAPGIWTAGLVSGVIGTHLPGPGTIYESQDLRFLKPVRIGDTISARVEVLEVLPARNRVRLRTSCRNQRGEEVLSGEAWVLPPRTYVSYSYAGHRPGLGALTYWALRPWAWTTQGLSLWTNWTALPSWWGIALCRR